jgi:hypothetical protein
MSGITEEHRVEIVEEIFNSVHISDKSQGRRGELISLDNFISHYIATKN